MKKKSLNEKLIAEKAVTTFEFKNILLFFMAINCLNLGGNFGRGSIQ